MLPAILGVSGALVFYSLAIWSEKLVGNLRKWMVIIFCLGFLFDLFGTSNMYFIATKHAITWHSGAGYVALIIMFAHLVWALLVHFKSKNKEKYRHYFHKLSIYAWLVWLVAFFSGIPGSI
jgi:uncharacterized repeat protein (TIGR03987 family)